MIGCSEQPRVVNTPESSFAANETSEPLVELKRNDVRVIDEKSGKPIAGATVTPIYPSFNGQPHISDEQGIAHIGGFGIPRGGYSVRVEAQGYQNFEFNTHGWDGIYLEISLRPDLSH